ncbi:MAG: flagellar protein FlgN [Oscillospiraceae bacterium]|nr:flagellar protein FlgN [Oscillospiraceae bacterium]
MSKNETQGADKLIELLSEKLELFEQIYKATEKQSKILSDEDYDIEAFDKLIDKRQELIEKINGLHQKLDPMMQSFVSSPSYKKDSEIEKLKDKIQNKVKECSDLNNENMEIISDKTDNQKDKIEKQSAKRKGIGGYAQAVPNTPEVFDRNA